MTSGIDMNTAISLACISGMSFARLEELVVGLGEPVYRAKQLRNWLYRGLAFSFDEMTDLPDSRVSWNPERRQ